MWQSWHPALTPVRLTAWLLAFHSAATHCMEWQAPPQNSFVPVLATITCVAMTPPAPITSPITRRVRTEYLTLGVISLVHVLRANPGRLVPYVAMLPSVAFLFHE